MADTDKPCVYCSGPMFSPEDHWGMAGIAKVLEDAGYTTYLPQRDGLETGNVMGMVDSPIIGVIPAGALNKMMRFVMQAGFALDIYNVLEKCGALVFNMNGRVPDDGSIVETAAVWTAGRPLVIYKNSPVSEIGTFDNPMVTGLSSTWKYVNDVKKIPEALGEMIEKTAESPYQGDNIPAHVQKVIKFGKEVEEFLELVRVRNPKEQELFQMLKRISDWVEKLPLFREAFPHS